MLTVRLSDKALLVAGLDTRFAVERVGLVYTARGVAGARESLVGLLDRYTLLDPENLTSAERITVRTAIANLRKVLV